MSFRVLLNCFPPTNISMPAIGCEVLNSYISKNKQIETEVVYWNYLFEEKTPEGEINLFQPKNDLDKVLPFLVILYEYTNPKIVERALFRMQEINPSFKSLGINHYKEKLNKQIKQIYKIIDHELEKLINIDDVLLFGVSAKFDSWIPGIVVAKEVKRRKPDAICLIGGIEDKNSAEVLFQDNEVFDFAIWGEGEIPLSLLIDKIFDKDDDYKEIPRLLSRSDLSKQQIAVPKNFDHTTGYLNMKEYPNINYDTFFEYSEKIEKKHIVIPIEISRGCRWNRCSFCALNLGYLYRTQNLESVVSQIKGYYEKYKIPRFFFVDNDVVGKNIETFEKLLDSLIQLSSDIEIDFEFHADILHLKFNKGIMKKLSLAGFKSVQIGYEAVSDSMLKKLNKSTTFAENLLFIKFAQKYDVEVTITGLIIGIPGELEEDVFESTNNLHFLRFFLGKMKNDLQHRFGELMLFYKTGYWEMLPQEEREKFNKHPLNDFLPEEFIKNTYLAYSVLGQYRRPPLKDKWDSFKSVSDFYEKSNFRYFLIEDKGIINYFEYKDNLKVESLVFNQSEYWDVLKLANDEITNLSKLHREISKKYPNIKKDRLIEIVEELKSISLLYSSKNHQKMISIIDTDNL